MTSREPPALLHNSGVPPRTTVVYSGIGRSERCRAPLPYHGPGLVIGTAEVQEEWRDHSPEDMLELLGAAPAEDAEAELIRLIDGRARELPLPDGLAVFPEVVGSPAPWPDPLSTLALLTKSSDSVWLREKRPRLRLARTSIALLVPPPWADPIARSLP